MWLLIARAPRPDAPQWPGRRALAVVDALLWPACLMLAALHLPPRAGIVQGAVVAISCFAALPGGLEQPSLPLHDLASRTLDGRPASARSDPEALVPAQRVAGLAPVLDVG